MQAVKPCIIGPDHQQYRDCMQLHGALSRAFRAGSLLFCLALFMPCLLQAQYLGEVSVLSSLGDPVEVEVAVEDWEGLDLEALEVALASPGQYEGFGLEWRPVLDTLRFNLVGPSLDGRLRVLVSSLEPAVEPYLDLLLSLRWPGGSLLREYVLLFDLPPPAAGGGSVLVQSGSGFARSATGRRVYQVHAGEVFWHIAQQFLVAGEDGSLYQMLLALYELNPGAFINDNISLLRADALLQIPEPADLQRIDAGSAESRFEALWAAGTAALRPPPDFVALAPPGAAPGQGPAGLPAAREPGTETGRVLPRGNGWLLPANMPVIMPLGAEDSPQDQEGALLRVRQRTLDALASSPRLGALASTGQDGPGRLALQASTLLTALSLQAERRARLRAAIVASQAELQALLAQTLQTRAALEAVLAESELRQALVWKQWLALVLLAGILVGLAVIVWLLVGMRRRAAL